MHRGGGGELQEGLRFSSSGQCKMQDKHNETFLDKMQQPQQHPHALTALYMYVNIYELSRDAVAALV